jgi:malonyl-CoA/methylmalonyl-CoA synthetase
MLPLFQNAESYGSKIAIISNDVNYTYSDLLEGARGIASMLLANSNDLHEARVGFIIAPGFDYVKVQWGIWMAGGIAVPLCITYPLASLTYVMEDTQASFIIADDTYHDFIRPLTEEKKIILFHCNESMSTQKVLPSIELDRKAMILYTSGTTNLPKGVVTTHKNIAAQISTLIDAWQWTRSDHTICILPLHHVHGIINVVSCSLWSGATLEFLPSFSEKLVFDSFLKGSINVFMAVPTIYFKLISYFENCTDEEKQNITACLTKFRLMVSGSAALPISVLEKWKIISTHTLLERYGMTEIGMGISNPYIGERKPGYIGKALQGVSVRLMDEGYLITEDEKAGEIQIKGDSVFQEYWQKQDATSKAFTEDGWFKTGDIAIVENNYYKILGRDSIDIIKSGGYKISALEIEEVLRTHPSIKDCSVIGIPNEEWGELVAACIITSGDISLDELNKWMREKMPSYKTPRLYKVIEDLPRNAMGKVTKNDLKKLFN